MNELPACAPAPSPSTAQVIIVPDDNDGGCAATLADMLRAEGISVDVQTPSAAHAGLLAEVEEVTQGYMKEADNYGLVLRLAAALRAASPSPGAVEAATTRLREAAVALIVEAGEGEVERIKGWTLVALTEAVGNLDAARRTADGGKA